MGRAVIRKGDPTSHGGKVLEGDPDAILFGLPIAKRGHNTFCPQCKGTFPIAEGSETHGFGGIGTALDGMKTACGATLIATQHLMTVDAGGSGAASSSPSSSTAPAAASSGKFNGRFRAVDQQSREPIPGQPYAITLADGQTLRGATDAEGYTERVHADDPATITLRWVDEEAADD